MRGKSGCPAGIYNVGLASEGDRIGCCGNSSGGIQSLNSEFQAHLPPCSRPLFHSCLGGLALELGFMNTQGSDSEVITIMSQRNSGSSSLPPSGERTNSHLDC